MRALQRAGLVALVFGAVILGCSDSRTGPDPAEPSVETQLAQLRQRISDLKVAVEVAGRMTPELQAELARLQDDVTSWQQRSGRHDVSFSRSERPRNVDSGSSPLSAVIRGDPGSTCAACPITTSGPGRICFLTYQGDCGSGILGRVCVYVCFSTVTIG